MLLLSVDKERKEELVKRKENLGGNRRSSVLDWLGYQSKTAK